MQRRLKINSASPLCINTRRRRAAAQFSRPRTPQESDCPNDRRIPPIFLKRKSFPPQISKPTAQCAIRARSTLPLKGLTPLTKIGYANSSIPSPVPNKGAKCASHGRGKPLTKIGFANTSIPLLNPNKKRTSHMRGSLTLPEFVPQTPVSRFGAMILDEERGRHGPVRGGREARRPLKGYALTKIGFANSSIPSPVPNKGAKCASHGRGKPLTKIGFANTSIPLLNPNKKRTSHMRGSLTLPEFVPQTPVSRFGAMILDEERGRHGPPAIEGAMPLTKIGSANTSIPT